MQTSASGANRLCQTCGLCCTGHLFVWAKLKSTELDSAQTLGLKVFREPQQRGFNQPCPLWQGDCTIYHTLHYPHFCRTYKCKLLKKLIDESIALPDALAIITQTKEQILDLETFLPEAVNPNFRERLEAQVGLKRKYVDPTDDDTEFLAKAEALIRLYADQFGVKDLVDLLQEE